MIKRESHHGSTWKVAYADFVTAMMALFLVLWIAAMNQEMKESVAGYFRSTALLNRQAQGTGSMAPIIRVVKHPIQTVPTPQKFEPTHQEHESGAAGEKMLTSRSLGKDNLQETATTILKLLRGNNGEITNVDAFRLEFTNDGFRIEVLDMPKRPLFEKGGAALTEYGRWVLQTIAFEVERFPFRIEVEGHTQAPPLGEPGDPWELSTRRALAAKQCLEENGVGAKQFWRVAGLGDRQPLNTDVPGAEINRRISVLVRLDPTSDLDSAIRTYSVP
ncbi:MAG: OmpA family protein [Verrucomicrobia bacterium]|nr:OmpA family protein [Verrucomicrobiota bacterium]